MNTDNLPANAKEDLDKKVEELFASLTENEQKLAMAFMIMYAAVHPEILTDEARKALEEFEASDSQTTDICPT